MFVVAFTFVKFLRERFKEIWIMNIVTIIRLFFFMILKNIAPHIAT